PSFSFSTYDTHRHLPSFPTRRSSDLAQVLLHLADQVDRDALVVGVDLHRVVDFRQVPFLELGVERRADDLHDLAGLGCLAVGGGDRKSTRLNSSHVASSYAVFCLKKK